MDVSVAIIGGGFSGIGLAVNLRKAGVEDFVVLERGGGVGGTWHYNTYPGCACDVPSNLYSFSFAPNPDWTRTYSRQPEIRAYLERVVDRFGVRPKIRLNTEVLDASWDEEARRWRLDTTSGAVTAKVLVSGTGPLVEPKLPDFPGLVGLRGPDHAFGPLGPRRRSARQARGVDRDRRLGDPVRPRDRARRRAAPRLPAHAAVGHAAQRAAGDAGREARSTGGRRSSSARCAAAIYAARELMVLGFVKQPRAMKLLETVGRRHRERSLRDPALIERTTPDYTVGCKRILPSNDWYPALRRSNVVAGDERRARGARALDRDRRRP